MCEIMKMIESIRKIDEEIKRLQVERHKYIQELQEKIKELLEETEKEMTIKCLEFIIKEAPEYKEIMCVIKSSYGTERIEEYYKDVRSIKLLRVYKVLVSELLTEDIIKFIAEEFNKYIVVIEES